MYRLTRWSLFLLCAPLFTAVAQIPNPGFEQWTSGEPDGWMTVNVVSFGVPVTQSATAHSGSSALAGTVVNTAIGPYSPIIQNGEGGGGSPISQRYATLTGYYRFTPVAGDRFSVIVTMMKDDSPVAVGAIALPAAVGAYTQFTVTPQYLTPDVPDTCIIQVSIVGPTSGNDMHVGSTYLIDDLVFSGAATSVDFANTEVVPKGMMLGQNFPNPFNPATEITYQIAVDSRQISVVRNVCLRIFDALGREVALLVNEAKGPGTYVARWDASGMPSGVYLYRLETAEGVQIKRMVLLK